MTRTRANDTPGSSGTAPQPEPSLNQILAALVDRSNENAELLHQFMHANARNGPRQRPANQESRHSSFSEFMGTHPPDFDRAREPMDADDWLRVLESKFRLLNCTSNQKVIFAAQQLRGPASAWWASFVASQPAEDNIQWDQFKTAFKANFSPPGLVKQKAREFLDLKQGGRSVVEYVEKFQNLSQYAPTYVDSEDKKRQYFLGGLNATLVDRLNWQKTGSLNDLIDAAITQEGTMRRAEAEEREERKRKAPSGPPANQQHPQKYRLVYTSPSGQRFRTAQQYNRPQPQQGYYRPQPQYNRPQQQYQQAPQQQQYQNRPAPQQNNNKPAQDNRGGPNACYNCGRTGHFIKDCKMPPNNPPVNPPRQQQRQQKNGNPRVGKVNYMDAEEIPAGEQVMTGMFHLLGYPVQILFDSGASHNFVSKKCVEKCGLTTISVGDPYRINSPGGQIIADRILLKVPIEMNQKTYAADFIMLDRQNIDLILGMLWMKYNRALLDIASRRIHLNSPFSGPDVISLTSEPSLNSLSVHHLEERTLESIPVVKEFPDVFPDDISGLPPDRDIEFKIELQPGTTPISKPPYKMGPKELAEMKTQLKELLEKGFIRPSTSPWGCPAIFVEKKDHSECV